MNIIETPLNSLISYGLSIIFIYTFIYIFFIRNIRLHLAKKAATKNPTYKNALKVYKLLCSFGIAINNHPKTWGEFRNMFYKINHSSSIPTELKQKIKDKLVKKGLYIDNMKIIDNYKPNI